MSGCCLWLYSSAIKYENLTYKIERFTCTMLNCFGYFSIYIGISILYIYIYIYIYIYTMLNYYALKSTKIQLYGLQEQFQSVHLKLLWVVGHSQYIMFHWLLITTNCATEGIGLETQ
jgi:hypothetical protein